MIRWTGLAPWEFEFPFPGSLTSTFLTPPPRKSSRGILRRAYQTSEAGVSHISGGSIRYLRRAHQVFEAGLSRIRGETSWSKKASCPLYPAAWSHPPPAAGYVLVVSPVITYVGRAAQTVETGASLGIWALRALEPHNLASLGALRAQIPTASEVALLGHADAEANCQR